MSDESPSVRGDLEFVPIQQKGRHFILIRDPLGLVQEGRAVTLPLFQMMSLLNGKNTLRDLQVHLTRQGGGGLVRMEELKELILQLDQSFVLDSESFRAARDRIVSDFASSRIRAPSHCGRSYPADPRELSLYLNEIMALSPPEKKPEGKVRGIVSPHIDFTVGSKGYAHAYQFLKETNPSRVVVLGVGHQMREGLFCITDKDFDTPLGRVENASFLSKRLRDVGEGLMSETDFAHHSEHSIEFQVLFLRHLLPHKRFSIIPILCGSLQFNLEEYSRRAYLEKTRPLLESLRELLAERNEETLLVAGVDLSHIGPKFGHHSSAHFLEGPCREHDAKLLDHLLQMDPDRFWEESIRVRDRFNVCGFSALACLLEILPPSRGELLLYDLWHEEATRSGVSYSAVLFTSRDLSSPEGGLPI
jgi:MEMO1 family protein